jgi:xanthine dehydrogenase accessory factor
LADDVVVEWPDSYLDRVGPTLGPRDAVCVLTHDTKFDVPAILGALASEVGYIGAMGSRRTHEKRWERLLEAGASESELRARLMSPIGLDVGARTPEETAVSICAEIIAVRSGRALRAMSPLRDGSGPIH